MAKKISYFARNFADCRTELVNFVRQYYPEIFSDFNDASVGMMLLELNAAVSDMLGYHTDRMFQETTIDYAQERRSLMSLARTYGLKVPGKRSSVTICDFRVTVPVDGDTFRLDLAPYIIRGAQVMGGGKIFETVDDIDFSSPFTTGGFPNRLILPNVDSNGTIQSYDLVKRELVVNGSSRIYKKVINTSDVRPFFELILPETNVLSIDSVILVEGTNINTTPTIDYFFSGPEQDYRWFEVNALAEDKIFVQDTSRVVTAGVKPGKYVRVDKRFISEYTDVGFCKLIFGAGTTDTSSLCDFNINPALVSKIGDIINNLALGEIPSPNKTMFVRYRIGGGSNTNVGPNILRTVTNVDMRINSLYNNTTEETAVRQSLKVNNPAPALGGKDELTIDEIRNLIKYNFSSQNRAVTIKDYQSRITLMPGEFGVPFRSCVYEEQNKIQVYVLSLDENGKLSDSSTSALRDNIAEYLSDYRMLNDYIEVKNGKIYNLSFEFDLFIEKDVPRSQIISEVIKRVKDFMDINASEMGENVYLAQILEQVSNVTGVLNVIDLRVYNMVGSGKYSYSKVSQPYIDNATRQIDISESYTLFGEPSAMFEIKYPDENIICRVKTN